MAMYNMHVPTINDPLPIGIRLLSIWSRFHYILYHNIIAIAGQKNLPNPPTLALLKYFTE